MPNRLDATNSALPAFYMMIAVVAFSAFPVLLHLGRADASPFLFAGIRQISIAVGVVLLILALKERLPVNLPTIKDLKSHCKSKLVLALMFVSIVGHGGSGLFALGLSYVDVSIAALLYETWPLFLMLIMAFLFKGGERYRPITLSVLIFVVMAMAGVALVILSHNDTPQPLWEIGTNTTSSGTRIGVVLVLMGAIITAAQGACTLKIGTLLAVKHLNTKNHETAEILFVMVITCLGVLIAGGLLCLIGVVESETISSHQLIYAVTSGLFVNLVGMVAWRMANLKTKNLGVNALAYTTPLVALIWIWMFSVLDVPHLDYLIIGAMGVAAANLLINTAADKRSAYNALVVSLWVFGTIVWFTGEYLTDISLRTEVPLELPVTMFILVLAFRVDRLVRRTSQEEEWVFEALHKLELLSAKGQIDGKAAALLLKIDKSRLSALNDVYERLIVHFPTPQKKAGMQRTDADELTHVQHLVDNLVHSRQQGGNFGELIAVGIAGGLTVIGLIFFREREIFSDIAAFLLSSIVVFLLFNIVDLQQDRSDPILKKRKDGRHAVKFDDEGGGKNQQRIALVTSLVMICGFVFMFWSR